MIGITKRTNWAVFSATTLLAFYADLGILNRLFISVMSVGSLMSFAYLLIVIVLLCMAFSSKSVSTYNAKSNLMLIIAILLFGWYIVTTLFFQTPRVPIYFYIVYTIFPLIIPSLIKIDGKLFIKGIMIFPCWGIFFLNNLLTTAAVEKSESGSLMGMSYTLLVPVLANIVYLFSYFKQDTLRTRLTMLIFSIPNIAYAIQIFLFGSRGPFFTILFLPLLLSVINRKSNIIRIKRLYFLLVSFLFIALYYFFIPFLKSISQIGKSLFHVEFEAIEKFIRFDEMDMIDNGRNYIKDIAIQAIYENPLGHGLDQFYNNTGIVYPHNFVLQILYDCGVFIGAPFLFFLITRIVKKWKEYKYDEFSVLVFLLFISVPSALVSHDLWELGLLWLFFGSLMSNKFISE